MKICTDPNCEHKGKKQPNSNFGKRKNSFRSQCRVCRRRKSRESYLKNKEAINKKLREERIAKKLRKSNSKEKDYIFLESLNFGNILKKLKERGILSKILKDTRIPLYILEAYGVNFTQFQRLMIVARSILNVPE